MNDTEQLANAKYRKMCELAGLRRAGQHARIYGGKYDGHEETILAINWTDAEILMKRPAKVGGERWFPLSQARILDPDYGPMPSVTPTSHETPVFSPESEIEPPSVPSQPTEFLKPQIKSSLSWIPKKKS